MNNYAMDKTFANGAGRVIRYHCSMVLLFHWNGRPDGRARYIPHVRRYARHGIEHRSLAALLRAVVAEKPVDGGKPEPPS